MAKFTRRKFLKITGIVATGATAVCCSYMMASSAQKAQIAHTSNKIKNSVRNLLRPSKNSSFPVHEPYGKGVGIYPGRVTWCYDKEIVHWDGKDFWWRPNNFNAQRIQTMLDKSLMFLTGAETVQRAWQQLFISHNEAKGNKQNYQKGEKIAIKINLNGTSEYSEDHSGETHTGYTNPVLLRELIASLIKNGGVAPKDIIVYDVSRIIPDYMIAFCSAGHLKGAHFVGRNNCEADYNAPLQWSTAFTDNIGYFPTCLTQASYLINLAQLRGHSWGVSLCAKNHFGSFVNNNYVRPPVGANLHPFMTDKAMNEYMPHVDLIANQQLGGKTVLYMLDALICPPSEVAAVTQRNAMWKQVPFNGSYTSSLFLSQDPVAIDSVGMDFLMNEPTILSENAAVARHPEIECYLHEAGQVETAPSGIIYKDGTGETVTNLGVHDHWNNVEEKAYGRNLGKSEGIELICVK